MTFELIFNLAIFLFLIYNFINVGGAEPPKMEGTLNGTEYSRILLAVLIVLFAINIYRLFKDRKENEEDAFKFDFKGFITNKMVIGSIILIIYALTLDTVGFIVGSLVMFMLYSYLLGQRNIGKLILSAVISVAAIYLIFDVLLGIILPRGTGVFREFSLFIERFI